MHPLVLSGECGWQPAVRQKTQRQRGCVRGRTTRKRKASAIKGLHRLTVPLVARCACEPDLSAGGGMLPLLEETRNQSVFEIHPSVTVLDRNAPKERRATLRKGLVFFLFFGLSVQSGGHLLKGDKGNSAFRRSRRQTTCGSMQLTFHRFPRRFNWSQRAKPSVAF